MEQVALLIKISDIIEEEVTLKIGNVELKGFASVVPYQLNEGYEYKVLLGITVLDELKITKLVERTKELIRVNDSFSYLIRGVIKKGGVIDAGILLQDEMLEEYEYLLDEYVEIEVDRINVEFL